MPSPEPHSSPRTSTTAFFLGGVCLLFFLGLLTVATGGWFLILMAALGGILLFAGLHYLLWGWMMPKKGDEAAEADEVFDAPAPQPRWPLPDADRYTRF